jgi:Uncharacterized conserved protein
MANRICIDKTVYVSKPDGMGRAQKEMACYELLDRLGIAYQRLDHSAAMTVEDCGEVEKLLGIGICKNLWLANTRAEHFLLMMPGEKWFHSPEVSRQVNSTRLSFADAQSMERALHLTPGSMSVLGLMNDASRSVKLLIDRDILRCEFIGCHPCVNTTSLKLRLDDLLTKFLSHTGHEPVFVEIR